MRPSIVVAMRWCDACKTLTQVASLIVSIGNPIDWLCIASHCIGRTPRYVPALDLKHCKHTYFPTPNHWCRRNRCVELAWNTCLVIDCIKTMCPPHKTWLSLPNPHNQLQGIIAMLSSFAVQTHAGSVNLLVVKVHGAMLMLSGLGLSLIAWSSTWCNVGALRCKSLPKGNGNVHVPFVLLSVLGLSLRSMEMYMVQFWCYLSYVSP